MTTDKCARWAEQIVDYADRELAADECRAVEAHLDQCEPCRKLLGRLQKSLDLAGVVWQVASSDAGDGRRLATRAQAGGALHRRRSMFIAGSAAVAVSAAVVLFVVMAGVPRSEPAERGIERKQMASAVPKSKPATDPLGDLDVERLLRDHEQAARVSASARIVADIAANMDVERQARSFLEAYKQN